MQTVCASLHLDCLFNSVCFGHFLNPLDEHAVKVNLVLPGQLAELPYLSQHLLADHEGNALIARILLYLYAFLAPCALALSAMRLLYFFFHISLKCYSDVLNMRKLAYAYHLGEDDSPIDSRCHAS